ncbi:MAG: glutamine--fructose-6-phosphate transaminase (isomerizing) [Bacteroidales bacterium]|nr:glutamine--fructose-6-phosphate transaminase (isomerizing) [Bacteroidales bacterium]
MCGIVAYLGQKDAYPILLKGLYRLEYRGYDSAGVALMQESGIKMFKKKGRVEELQKFCENLDTSGTLGIAHTRWATHGEPNEQNAHPHVSEDGSMALIHNGIVENYVVLKQQLVNQGVVFKSETDTEVLVHLIKSVQDKEGIPLPEAVTIALRMVEGTYALAIISTENPDQLIVAKKGSPLLVGIGDNEYFIGSDGAPIVEYTKQVVYLEDGDVGVISRDKPLRISNVNDSERLPKSPYIQTLELSLEQLEKGGFDTYMLKEIYEQPKAVRDSMRGRINLEKDVVSLGGIIEYEQKMLNARRFIIVACGTSWHSGLIAEHLFETLVRIPVEVEYASEFRYRNPIIYEDDVLIAISQSGETADTLAAVEIGKKRGATVIGICNVVGSTMARETMAGSYSHAGPEIGVACTKTFTAQITVLALMALSLAKKKGTIPMSLYHKLLNDLETAPEKIESVLRQEQKIQRIAQYVATKQNAMFLGRGVSFPVALEGALKLKEISYIHAEGYPAAEIKHGPIALIDTNMPVIVVAPEQHIYDKVVSNIQEIIARKGTIISIVNEGDTTVSGMSKFTIEVPGIDELLTPLVTTIPLQLLSYHVALIRDCDVDKPRNLAKSVSVE